MSGMHILTRQVFAPDLTARTEHPLNLSIYHAHGGKGARPRPGPEITELKSGDTVEENGWQVHAASVRHVQPYLQCYGYRVEADDRVLAYSGDSGLCTPMERLAKEADVLIQMCHYLSGTQLNKAFGETCMDVALILKQVSKSPE